MGGMETGPFLLGYRLGYNKTKKTASIKDFIYCIAINAGCCGGADSDTLCEHACVHGMYTANTERPREGGARMTDPKD